jgi:hypothetical protein
MDPHPAVTQFKDEQRWRLVNLSCLHTRRCKTVSLLDAPGLEPLTRRELEAEQRSLEAQIDRTVARLRRAWDTTMLGVAEDQARRAGHWGIVVHDDIAWPSGDDAFAVGQSGARRSFRGLLARSHSWWASLISSD